MSVSVSSLLFFVIHIQSYGGCARILGVFYTPEYSHYMTGNTLMKILADRGHDVLMLSVFHEREPPPNYREIYLDGLLKSSKKPTKKMYDNSVNPFELAWHYSKRSVPYLEKFMSHRKFQNLITSNTTFDLVIIEQFACDSLLYLAKHFDAPLILFSTLNANSWTNRYMGNPSFPSYIPDVSLSFHEMDFWDRMQNVILHIFKEILFCIQVVPAHKELVKKNIPNASDISESLYNASLMFLNSDLSIHDPIPKVPSMIDIGGFHIDSKKSLPPDIEGLMNKSLNGIIFFSMGTTFKEEAMPFAFVKLFTEAFATLNETILWKRHDEVPNESQNIITKQWFPQNGILGHRNTKLFITHGGLHSMMEAIYHGIPMLCIPFGADQFSNCGKAVKEEFAISIDIFKITNESLLNVLRNLLSDPKYSKNAKKRSLIMRNVPILARDKVIFWVENVIQNRGAPHLRVASLSMPGYQYFLIDVIGFFILVLIILFLIIFISLKFVCRVVRERSVTKKIN